MKNLYLLISLCFISVFVADAQVMISEDPLVSAMMDRKQVLNRSTYETSGWRLQLAASTDREKVTTMQGNFESRYSHLSIKWVYKAPYYKLIVGAYRTKLEATALKHQLRYDYPDAYLVRDKKIQPNEFN